MNPPATSDFLLLSRGQWDRASAKADIEAAIDQFYTWYEANLTKGIFKPGSRLTMDAALVTRDGIRYEIRPLESERGTAYRQTNETPTE